MNAQIVFRSNHLGEADAKGRAASPRGCTRHRKRPLAGEPRGEADAKGRAASPRGCTRQRKQPLAGEPRG